MFDVSRLVDLVTGIFSQSEALSGVGSALEQLQGQGIDLAQLQDLDAQQLMTVLSDAGLDPNLLDVSQVADLAQHFGTDLPIQDLLGQLTDRSS